MFKNLILINPYRSSSASQKQNQANQSIKLVLVKVIIVLLALIGAYKTLKWLDRLLRHIGHVISSNRTSSTTCCCHHDEEKQPDSNKITVEKRARAKRPTRIQKRTDQCQKSNDDKDVITGHTNSTDNRTNKTTSCCGKCCARRYQPK